jgi:hypothetical protein
VIRPALRCPVGLMLSNANETVHLLGRTKKGKRCGQRESGEAAIRRAGPAGA